MQLAARCKSSKAFLASHAYQTSCCCAFAFASGSLSGEAPHPFKYNWGIPSGLRRVTTIVTSYSSKNLEGGTTTGPPKFFDD